MSEETDGGGSHKTRDDPWMSTVTSASAFLAGFSLACGARLLDLARTDFPIGIISKRHELAPPA